MIIVSKDNSVNFKSEQSLFLSMTEYNPVFLSRIKSLGERKYVPEKNKSWEVPLYLIKNVTELFEPNEIRINEDVDMEHIKPEIVQTYEVVKDASAFNEELNYIQDEKIREFTRKALERMPNYFYSIPASSTGKYHPRYCLGEGGLVRHCKACARIANDLFRFSTLYKFTQLEEDMIISALLMHDGCKNSDGSTSFTAHEHPLYVCDYIKGIEELDGIISEEIREMIFENIRTHMSSWNISTRSSIVLPLPESDTQKFTAMCDYLASRKCIEINFEV